MHHFISTHLFPDEELEDGQVAEEDEFSDEEDGDGLLGRTKSVFEMAFRKVRYSRTSMARTPLEP